MSSYEAYRLYVNSMKDLSVVLPSETFVRISCLLHNMKAHDMVYMFPQPVHEECLVNKESSFLCLCPPEGFYKCGSVFVFGYIYQRGHIPEPAVIIVAAIFNYIVHRFKDALYSICSLVNYLLRVSPAENTRARSDAFAAQNNLPKLEYVLHPRSTGFTFIVDRLRKGEV